MSPERRRQRAMLRELMTCLKREAAAIARRDFRAIADLGTQKQTLADQLETLPAPAGAASVSALAGDLREIEEIARANAVQLKNFRDGVVRARDRMRDLTASNMRVGVYEAQGRQVKIRADRAVGKSA